MRLAALTIFHRIACGKPFKDLRRLSVLFRYSSSFFQFFRYIFLFCVPVSNNISTFSSYSLFLIKNGLSSTYLLVRNMKIRAHTYVTWWLFSYTEYWKLFAHAYIYIFDDEKYLVSVIWCRYYPVSITYYIKLVLLCKSLQNV